MKTFNKALLLPINKQKEVMLQDRSNIAHLGVSLNWGYFGGEIEGEETNLEAVIREAKEELSIDLDKDKLHSFFKTTYKPYSDIEIEAEYFLWEIDIPLNKIEVKEGVRYKFFTPDEAIKVLKLEGDKEAVRKLGGSLQ